MGYLKNSLMESLFKAFGEQLATEIIDYLENKMNISVLVEEVKDQNCYMKFYIHNAISNSPIPICLIFRASIFGPAIIYSLFGMREISCKSFEEISQLFDFMNSDDGILEFIRKSILLVNGGEA